MRRFRITFIKLCIVLLILVAAVFIFFSLSSPVTQYTDSYLYELPFEKGSRYRVVQGYGGLFSHKNIAAIDFAMPVGTPIHAAREGVVYAYKDDSNEGGPFAKYKNKANYLMIRHGDGTIACYWHLQQNGVVVKKGAVKKGELIGYSGRTGFVLRPHLHFSVKRKLNYEKNSFVKTKFWTTEGIIFLKNRRKYERPEE
jgi:murein DD-endopeptidase MepM/ murein hydrolase activator NlpD